MRKQLMINALLGICWLTTWAQPQNYNALKEQAKAYYEQKEYIKSIECYEKAIDELKGTEYESLVPTVRNSIAINNLYLGVAAIKEKDFSTAKLYLDNALADAKPDSKTYYTANSWMGQWNSIQALNIRLNNGDYQKAIQFSLEAEHFFDLANEPEKRLSEQLSRSSSLLELLRNDEAEALLNQIISECNGITTRRFILGRAKYQLGGIELASERFQSAIQHFEKSYDICIRESAKDAKTWARLSAQKLYSLYSTNVPDNNKSDLWKKRADELEPQSSK